MRIALVMCVLGACTGPAAMEPSTEPSGATTSAEAPQTETERPAGSDSVSPAPTDESLCPPLVASRRGDTGGRGASLHPELRSDPDGLSAAIPEAVGAWSRTRQFAYHEGHAGHMSAGADATFAQGAEEARVSVADLVHVCLCESGDGERLRDLAVAAHADSSRALELGGWPALSASERDEATLSVWVRECCHVTVHAPSAEAALELARGLDLARLEATCDEHRTGGLL